MTKDQQIKELKKQVKQLKIELEDSQQDTWIAENRLESADFSNLIFEGLLARLCMGTDAGTIVYLYKKHRRDYQIQGVRHAGQDASD